MNIPKTPAEFDYDLWTTEDGKCMVRVKRTGEVTEVERDVMRIQYAAPVALMTSYNLLNGVHTSERQDLLDGIVRNEWGYRGLIVSDWITKLSPTPEKYPYTSTWKSICAGNDLIMPGGEGDFNEILHALASGALTREKLEQCATNVVKTVRKLKISANGKEK